MLSTLINQVKLNVHKDALQGELLPSYNIADIEFNEYVADLIERFSRKALDKLMLKTEVENEDFNYAHIWAILKVIRTIGIPDFYISAIGELSSSVSDSFIIKQAKYMHSISLLMPELIDFKQYFIHGNFPFSSWAGAVGLPMYTTVEARHALNKFYMSYDLKTLFDTFGPRENDILGNREKERREAFDFSTFDLSKFMASDPTAFVRGERATGPDVWDCSAVSKAGEWKAGSQTFVDVAEFRRRFAEYTYGWLEKSPNPDLEGKPFNWKNICIAGGSVEQCLTAEYKPVAASDVDIFIYGKTFKETKAATNRLIDWFTSPKTYFGVVGSVIYVYILDCPRVFQIISTDHALASEIISDFDLSSIQYAFFSPVSQYDLTDEHRTIESYQVGEIDLFRTFPFQGRFTVIATKEAIDTGKDGLSRVMYGPRTSGERVLKNMRRGYNILPTKDTLEDFNIMELIRSNNHIYKELIQSLNIHWFPRSSDTADMTPAEATDMIEGMIRKMSKATIASAQPSTVRENITYAGNFASDYTRMQFINYRITSVKNLRQERRVSKYLQGVANRIQVLTAPGEVTRFIANEDEIIIDVKYTDRKFIEFIEDSLEDKTLKLVTQQPVSEKLLKDGTITYKMKVSEIRAREERNFVVSRRINGEPINTFEDIAVGQNIQVIIHIHLEHSQDSRKFTFHPRKFLLLDADNAPADAPADDDDAEPDPEDKLVETADKIIADAKNTLEALRATNAPAFAQIEFE